VAAVTEDALLGAAAELEREGVQSCAIAGPVFALAYDSHASNEFATLGEDRKPCPGRPFAWAATGRKMRA
jgi:hypothetical protein